MINQLICSQPYTSMLNSNSLSSVANQAENYPIIGHSPAITRVKKQIEFASNLAYAIFISGENGCEKTTVAWHIHHLSSDKKGKFITIPSNINDPFSYKNYILMSIPLAKNGTLCIEDIDGLSEGKKDELISIFALSDFTERLKENNTRLIITCFHPLIEQKTQQYIAELLGPAMPQFNFHLPPLRERNEDIIEHIDFILSNLKVDIDVSQSALSLLQRYDWPGNISELQRLVLFLASYCDNQITEEDILSLGIIKSDTLSPNKINIVDCILNKDLAPFQSVHPSLSKALKFLSEHFLEAISLEKLASAAYTSPSHLSYLFRNFLNTSFKSLLNQTRIQFSKKLIDRSTNTSITEICMHSGFGDLSHFEKMFKRYIGCTPRQYRKKQRESKDYFSV